MADKYRPWQLIGNAMGQRPHICKLPFIIIGGFRFTSVELEELVLSDNKDPVCYCFSWEDID